VSVSESAGEEGAKSSSSSSSRMKDYCCSACGQVPSDARLQQSLRQTVHPFFCELDYHPCDGKFHILDAIFN
jgi:hypothetical protein